MILLLNRDQVLFDFANIDLFLLVLVDVVGNLVFKVDFHHSVVFYL